MAETRLTMTKERLNQYYDAEKAILAGQEYKIGTRSLKRADLKTVQDAIKELEKTVDELTKKEITGASRKSFRITPRDL
ncbi:MAG: hypothetical protein CVV56_08050 [Tenericutes bacterium HGW-Tenericutes-1]|jgi:hypothetical protein|nr:MAG: hypothetical protein CVV56_08050 [Tenericutes bacterium HGW-Tenericutes-1]PKM95797.1 MAG: hypothetical protein CVU84_03080 [Firmicutes bacterium HGW-Firmicutes-1]